MNLYESDLVFVYLSWCKLCLAGNYWGFFLPSSFRASTFSEVDYHNTGTSERLILSDTVFLLKEETGFCEKLRSS